MIAWTNIHYNSAACRFCTSTERAWLKLFGHMRALSRTLGNMCLSMLCPSSPRWRLGGDLNFKLSNSPPPWRSFNPFPLPRDMQFYFLIEKMIAIRILFAKHIIEICLGCSSLVLCPDYFSPAGTKIWSEDETVAAVKLCKPHAEQTDRPVVWVCYSDSSCWMSVYYTR